MLFKYAVLSCITTFAASALEFEQFEGQHHFIDTKVLNTAPDGHELHFIKDAANNIFEWDGTEYSHHDVEVHHNDEGHHLSTVFDFATPPTTLQKDGAGHALVEIYNTRVILTTETKNMISRSCRFFAVLLGVDVVGCVARGIQCFLFDRFLWSFF